MLITVLSVWFAVLLDWLAGEPKRWHPLVGFGCLATYLEKKLNPAHQSVSLAFLKGLIAWSLAVLPLTAISLWISTLPWVGVIFSIVLLYCCIGHRSLYEHIQPITQALQQGRLDEAKHHTSYIVSRDKAQIEVEKASIESILENGNDAIFGALFWFMLLGAPGVMLYRLSNTLDAMWGYKTPKFLYFGKTAARIDDLLNLVPARLTALSYALLGNTRLALRCWRQQAALWDSPNAGPVMAAGAGTLNISLGGDAVYHGKTHHRPTLGSEQSASAKDIPRALQLVSRTLLLWLLAFTLLAVVVVYA